MPTVVKRDATREGGRSHRFRAARRRCAARQRSTDLVRCSTVCVRQGGAWPVRRGGRPGRASRGRTSIRASIRTAVATPPVGACPAPRAPAGERRIACMRERMRRVTPEHAARAEPEPTRITAPLARRRAPLAAPPAGRSADRPIGCPPVAAGARAMRAMHAMRRSPAGTPARDGARRPPSLRVAKRAPHAGPDIARCAASSATAPVPHRKTAFGPSADGRPLWTTVSRAFGRLVGRVRRAPFFFGGAHSPRMRRTHGMGTRR